MANTVGMVSTKVRRTTLDNLRELYGMRYARTKESMAAILDRLVQTELERVQAEELNQLLDMRSNEMRSDPIPTDTANQRGAGPTGPDRWLNNGRW